jgi:glycosyltransferase involved in cell wall biosynthesis
MAKLRILLNGGFSSVIGPYERWRRGEDEPAIPDVAYSHQFFDVCRELGAEVWAIGAQPKAATLDDGDFRLEDRPIPFDGQSGAKFHLGRMLYTLSLLRSALQHRADVAVVNQHGVHWFLVSLFPLFGIKVVPAIHNTLWLDLVPPTPVNRGLLRLARPFFSRQCAAVLAHPGTCVRQLEELGAGVTSKIEAFIPLYRQATFGGLPERGPGRPPFRVLYAGRIETNKGVFDLVEIARQLAERGRDDIEIDICGTGSVLEKLRGAIAEAGVGARMRCHGRLPMGEFREMFGRCHAVIVPTRSNYDEGFNAVVAEAVLSGRPVITSKVVPAIDVVRAAVVEAAPEDVASYRDAILRLVDDEAFYESKHQACAQLKQQFFDAERSWGAAFRRILSRLGATPAN